MSTQTPLERLSPSLVHPVDRRSMPSDTEESPIRVDRAYVRTISGMQKEAIVSDGMSEDSAWRLSSDEGDYLDGDDVAPCPLGNMAVGMVATYLDAITALAAERDLYIEDVDVVLDNFYTMQGSALRGDIRGGALDPEVAVRIDLTDGDVDVEGFVEEAIQRSPIADLLENALTNRFSLSLDGDRLATDRVPDLGAQNVSDPLSVFAEAERGSEPFRPDVVTRTGRTTEEYPGERSDYTAGKGSSLQAEQDRVLHVRGQGSVRGDGMYEVVQKIYSPKGTVFEFLADRRPSLGGERRAPDGLTYIAAGIGFCFLTQFGRYAEIHDKELSEYGIVQDITWPDGSDASVEPIDTHVFIESPEGSEFATELLDISEQTCFLHALCRSEIAPDVTVEPIK